MGAIASLDYTKEERQKLAKKSLEFHCPECGLVKLVDSNHLSDQTGAVQAEAREIASQMTMKGETGQEPQTTDGPQQQQQPQQQSQQAAVPRSPALPRSSFRDQTYNMLIASIVAAIALLLLNRFALFML